MKTFIMNLKLTFPVSSGYTSFFCSALAFHAPITFKSLLVTKCAVLHGSSYELSLLPGIFPSPILCSLVRLTFICPLTLDLGCIRQGASLDLSKFKLDALLENYHSRWYFSLC